MVFKQTNKQTNKPRALKSTICGVQSVSSPVDILFHGTDVDPHFWSHYYCDATS